MAAEVVALSMSKLPTIPITNLYYLLCYAWNHFSEGAIVSVRGVQNSSVENLLATVLIKGTHHLMRRGVDRGYIPRREDTARLRGRIIFAETLERNLAGRAMAHCEFDELEYDVLHNQILKTTLCNLSKTDQLDNGLQHELLELVRRFPEVSVIRLNQLTFRKLQLSRNTAFYDFLMKVCELVQAALLPEENSGRFRFRDILRDEMTMSKVFEDFVYNFYRLEQKDFKVRRERIYWDLNSGSDWSTDMMLPSMLTDVSLRSIDRTLVVDTKYTPRTFQNFRDSETVRSPHLYQIFAYLKNLEAKGGSDVHAEGLLLYPTASEEANLMWEIQGHKIRVYTINLAQDWTDIRSELLELLNSPEAGSAPGTDGVLGT
jgi:5-methylcytosine-specific restriction enzyme subunit McrC